MNTLSKKWFSGLGGCFLFLVAAGASLGTAQSADRPHPVTNPDSPLMLAGEWVPGGDSHQIDFAALPRIPSRHVVVSDALGEEGHRVNQHNYLVHYDGKFWAMWSDGPGISRGYGRVPGHDQPDQRVSYASSEDGLTWSEIGDLSGPPAPGFGWIARGFWVREGKLLGLASHFNAPNYRGEGLALHAFEYQPSSSNPWRPLGVVYDDALNNFPPKRVPTGEWLMSRRDHRQNVHFLRGGVAAFDRWESTPMVDYGDAGLAAEEPYWWILPDNNLVALFRDNNRSGYLFRSFSTDHGRTWTRPVRTNFPDARSKFSGLRLSDGRYVLVSNANPNRRDPLVLSISDDGLIFTKMGYLVGGRSVDYPHVIEHQGALYIAFATAKQTVEVLQVRIADLDRLEMAAYPVTTPLTDNMAPERPNVVVILADDLGYGDLGIYGGRARTPHLDRLAREGMLFTDFHSNGASCSPTRAALLTGRYQQRMDVEGALGEDAAGLPQEEKTIAGYLAGRGYVTGIFGKWHLGYHPENGPWHHGFDEFRGHLHGAVDYFSKVDRYGRLDWWHNDRQIFDAQSYATDMITQDAVDFIRTNRNRPFFAFVSHQAIHFPWQAPDDRPHRRPGLRYEEIRGERSRGGQHSGDIGDVVTKMIESLDQGVGRIIETLRAEGLDGRTLVFFTSDNGGIVEYGGGWFTNISSNGPLRGAKQTIYEGGHRVPAIAWWPGRIGAGSVTEVTTMTMDLAPTFLELAGIELPAADGPHAFDGISLNPVLFHNENLLPRDLYWRISNGDSAIRSGPWKLVVPTGARLPKLYHLGDDIGQTRDLAARHPERVALMKAKLAAWERDVARE